MNKPIVELIGVDGNAFMIFAACESVAKKSGWNSEQIDSFINEAMSGDYQNLLRIVSENFDIK